MTIVNTETADKYQKFFNFMQDQHGLTLTISEMDDILHEAKACIDEMDMEIEASQIDEIVKELDDAFNAQQVQRFMSLTGFNQRETLKKLLAFKNAKLLNLRRINSMIETGEMKLIKQS